MIKDIHDTNEDVAPNSRKMAVLKENFPSCFHKDGKFDIERFKEFLIDKVSVTGEGYEMKFLGKNYARLLASVDTSLCQIRSITQSRRMPPARTSILAAIIWMV